MLGARLTNPALPPPQSLKAPPPEVVGDADALAVHEVVVDERLQHLLDGLRDDAPMEAAAEGRAVSKGPACCQTCAMHAAQCNAT